MENIFFFQTKQIHDNTNLFHQFKKQKIFYSYFQVDQNYYLFFYAQESIDIHFLYQSVQVIQELDSKQRKIRSFRGFLLYALEIIQNSEDYEILNTNLQPFFWRKVKNIIRQNKKAALQEFLFGLQDSIAAPETQNHLNEKIESLETQLSSLQQKVIDLEAKLENPKSPRSRLLEGLESTKSIQQSDSTLEVKLPLLRVTSSENNSEVRDSTSRGKDMESKSFSEAPRRPFQPLSGSQQYNISSNQEKGLQEPNFITLGRIPEQERIEIIQRGFQLQAEGKISLKKYYESTYPYSLFQFKGYSIKYESIRRTKFYQTLKTK